jgi:hypothetical protein
MRSVLALPFELVSPQIRRKAKGRIGYTAYLKAGSGEAGTALARNRDDSCANDANHALAPTVSDAQESAFGALDFALGCTRAGVFAAIGQMACMRMHIFDTKAQKVEASVSNQNKKQRLAQKAGGSGAGSAGAGQGAEAGSEWDMTDFFAWPAEERWEVLQYLLRHFDELCVKPEKEQVQAQRNETVRRHQRQHARRVVAQKNKHLRYCDYAKKEEAKTAAELREMITARQDEAMGNTRGEQARKEKAQAALVAELVLQIQIRKHVYGVWRPVAVTWTNKDVDAADLQEKVIAMIQSRPKERPPCPPAIPQWERAANPSAERVRLDAQWHEAEKQANFELGALMSEGRFFIAGRRGSPTRKKKQAAGDGAAAKGAGRKRKVLEPTASDQAVRDQEFEDEGTQWVVHDVRFEEITGGGGRDESCIIVLYYEKGDTEAQADEDCMEWSTVGEVKEWIQESCAPVSAPKTRR